MSLAPSRGAHPETRKFIPKVVAVPDQGRPARPGGLSLNGVGEGTST